MLFPSRRDSPYLAAVNRILPLTPKDNGWVETISSSMGYRSRTFDNAEILRSVIFRHASILESAESWEQKLLISLAKPELPFEYGRTH